MKYETTIIKPGNLTPRETQIFSGLCNALSDKQIARELGIALSTVNTHLDRIYIKLDVQHEQINQRIASIRVALERGMIKFPCLVLALSMGFNAGDFQAARVSRPASVRVSARRVDS